MQNLLNFLYRFRTFGLFLLLEGICAWLIIAYNNRPNAAFLNSSNALVASINTLTSNTTDYFQLQEINDRLIRENQLLREQVANMSLQHFAPDTTEQKYKLYRAKVINNTYRRSMNFLTLDIGARDSISPGMGVISGDGVIGQVKSVSDHFSTVTSLLHRNLLISSAIQRTNTLCTVQWDGEDPTKASLKYVPRHVPVVEGDSIVTSGYNAVFPEGILIGTVSDIHLEDNDVFYEAKVDLAVDFSSLEYVYLVDNLLKQEQDSLEIINEQDQ